MKGIMRIGVLLIISCVLAVAMGFAITETSSGQGYGGTGTTPTTPIDPPIPPETECNLVITNFAMDVTEGPVGTVVGISGNYTGEAGSATMTWQISGESGISFGGITASSGAISGSGTVPIDATAGGHFVSVNITSSDLQCSWGEGGVFTVTSSQNTGTDGATPAPGNTFKVDGQDYPMGTIENPYVVSAEGYIPPKTGVEMFFIALAGGLMIVSGYGMTRYARRT